MIVQGLERLVHWLIQKQLGFANILGIYDGEGISVTLVDVDRSKIGGNE